MWWEPENAREGCCQGASSRGGVTLVLHATGASLARLVGGPEIGDRMHMQRRGGVLVFVVLQREETDAAVCS